MKKLQYIPGKGVKDQGVDCCQSKCIKRNVMQLKSLDIGPKKSLEIGPKIYG